MTQIPHPLKFLRMDDHDLSNQSEGDLKFKNKRALPVEALVIQDVDPPEITRLR
jgi:hypothetical protein